MVYSKVVEALGSRTGLSASDHGHLLFETETYSLIDQRGLLGENLE